MTKIATYHLLHDGKQATAVRITITGTRDGYVAESSIHQPAREMSIEAGKVEMAALHAAGYKLQRGHDINPNNAYKA